MPLKTRHKDRRNGLLGQLDFEITGREGGNTLRNAVRAGPVFAFLFAALGREGLGIG